MPKALRNRFRGTGMTFTEAPTYSDPSVVTDLLGQCPAHRETPLVSAPPLAGRCGVSEVWIKDERGRMGLGSFKALGAAYVIARDAVAVAAGAPISDSTLAGRTYVAASAGNHGMSVAAGARIFGARAMIFLAETVPDAFAARLQAKGAEVVRAGAIYEDSMKAAEEAARTDNKILLSDSSWPGYTEIPHRVMEGYTQIVWEAANQMEGAPSHILLQAGVGGLAAAVASAARSIWGDGPQVIVVEPQAAPALIESIRAGEMVTTAGPDSCMGRLDCKEPSMLALAALSRDADVFVTITETEAKEGVQTLAEHGFQTTPSGAAGLAALIAGLPDIDRSARVLTILSEGPEDV